MFAHKNHFAQRQLEAGEVVKRVLREDCRGELCLTNHHNQIGEN